MVRQLSHTSRSASSKKRVLLHVIILEFLATFLAHQYVIEENWLARRQTIDCWHHGCRDIIKCIFNQNIKCFHDILVATLHFIPAAERNDARQRELDSSNDSH